MHDKNIYLKYTKPYKRCSILLKHFKEYDNFSFFLYFKYIFFIMHYSNSFSVSSIGLSSQLSICEADIS